MAATPVLNSAVQWLGIERLKLSEFRPGRYVPRPTAQQRQAILSHGVVTPLMVRSVKSTAQYEILSAPEAWVLAGLVGIAQVPVWVRDDIDTEQARSIVAEQYGVHDHDPIYEAEAFAALLAGQGARHGAITQLAVQLGRGRSYVAHALRLLKLPLAVQAMLRSGALTAGHGRALVTQGHPKRTISLALQIQRQKLTVRQAEQLCQAKQDPLPQPKLEPDPDVARMERAVSELIGCPFRIDQGRAQIDYFDDLDVLQGVLKRLGYIER